LIVAAPSRALAGPSAGASAGTQAAPAAGTTDTGENIKKASAAIRGIFGEKKK
jgi:hypothetical protein